MRRTAARLVSALLLSVSAACLPAGDALVLEDAAVRLEWRQTDAGWALDSLRFTAPGGDVIRVPGTSARQTVLFSETKPGDTPRAFSFKGATENFPGSLSGVGSDNRWARATTPALLNTAGEARHFLPSEAAGAGGSVVFRHEDDVAGVATAWRLDPEFPGDVLVDVTLVARKAGYIGLATPELFSIAPGDLAWAIVPGYFKGDRVNDDIPASLAYNHGLPALPVIVPDRCASTLASIATLKSGVTLSVLAQPSERFDPWPGDKMADRKSPRLGLSHMTRDGRLAPTLYCPVLGQQNSRVAPGDTRRFSFRYSLRKGDWFDAVRHAARDIYRLDDFLALKNPVRSLSDRLHSLHEYVVSDKTSFWHVEDFDGLKIGAQAYNAAVLGARRDKGNKSDYDALKNSDYGAMWMLATASGDPRLTRDRLPFARNFKLAQQQTAPGFFQGAALGQYYLAKSKRFTEEWGSYVEPIAITYYTMLDIGNILLFQPGDAALRERLRLGAERLLAWQHADGRWEVADDHATQKPLYVETPDFRPTFYGLLVAHKLLGDPRYLAAAKKGADWLVENAVKPARFLGVCGDARFVPDFATVQLSQAFLDLFELTGDARHRDAAIECARQYLADIYTHPVATRKKKKAKGVAREDWEINQTGLSFEHGGTLGSANSRGPILLSSYAGLFVRMSRITGETLFRDLARAAMIGRDAFLNPATQVASYYWNNMDAGPGGFPHHAWWQIGLITDYLVSEAALRSGGAVGFPRGFITPKVGPHACFGFAPGKIHGQAADLSWANVQTGRADVDYLAARSPDNTRRHLILLNNSARPVQTTVAAAPSGFAGLSAPRWTAATLADAAGQAAACGEEAVRDGKFPVSIPAFGIAVLTLETR
ncbi:MAG: glycerophosphoryl diester phosphodiesterase [Opitutaceae bacterium]|jgi:hypothetical protein|nr:glycerophosphoryl diester phosphodiesterase [Opitutaceae bacterium]